MKRTWYNKQLNAACKSSITGVWKTQFINNLHLNYTQILNSTHRFYVFTVRIVT